MNASYVADDIDGELVCRITSGEEEMGDLVDERRGDMDAIIEEQEEISESVVVEGGILDVLGDNGEKYVLVLLGRERFYYLDDAHLGAEGEGREIAFADHAGV